MSGGQSPPSSSCPSGNQSGPASPASVGDSLAWVGLGSQVAGVVSGEGGLRAVTSSMGGTGAWASAAGGPFLVWAALASAFTVLLLSRGLSKGRAGGFGSRKLSRAMQASSPSWSTAGLTQGFLQGRRELERKRSVPQAVDAGWTTPGQGAALRSESLSGLGQAGGVEKPAWRGGCRGARGAWPLWVRPVPRDPAQRRGCGSECRAGAGPDPYPGVSTSSPEGFGHPCAHIHLRVPWGPELTP